MHSIRPEKANSCSLLVRWWEGARFVTPQQSLWRSTNLSSILSLSTLRKKSSSTSIQSLDSHGGQQSWQQRSLSGLPWLCSVRVLSEYSCARGGSTAGGHRTGKEGVCREVCGKSKEREVVREESSACLCRIGKKIICIWDRGRGDCPPPPPTIFQCNNLGKIRIEYIQICGQGS